MRPRPLDGCRYGQPAAAEAFRRRYRLWPAGAEARRLGAEELLAPIKDSFTRGALFRLRVQDLFEAVSGRFQSSSVEFLVPSDASTEFLIGDTPTLPVDLTTGTAGLQAAVSLGDANTIMLPLAARLPVSLGRTTAIAQVPSRFVDQVNRVQALVQVPWVRHGAGHTRAFDDQVAWLATHTSKTAVVELMRVAWRTVGAIITRVVADARAAAPPTGCAASASTRSPTSGATSS